jgi:putative transposase
MAPQTAAIRSKPKAPTSPQLMAPTTARIHAIQSRLLKTNRHLCGLRACAVMTMEESKEKTETVLDCLGSPFRFFGRRAHQGRHAERKAMIDRSHDLPVGRQAQLVNISRGSAYYTAKPVSDGDLKLMRRVDELHLELPFAGARMLRDLLRGEGVVVGRKHMTTPMRCMAITALYRKPNTSKKTPGRTIYPYLLRTLPITRANQVWAMDISYIPRARGFIYLAAVIDWYSRRVLAWRVSISMDTEFCIEAVQEAIARYGTPEIFNTDQGSQFTSSAFIGLLTSQRIRISMEWQRLLAGQRVHRAAVALDQVRGAVPARLREREPDAHRNRSVHRVLQHPQAALEPAGPHTRYGVLQLAAMAFGPGSLTPQDPLKKIRNLFKRMGPPLRSSARESRTSISSMKSNFLCWSRLVNCRTPQSMR